MKSKYNHKKKQNETVVNFFKTMQLIITTLVVYSIPRQYERKIVNDNFS